MAALHVNEHVGINQLHRDLPLRPSFRRLAYRSGMRRRVGDVGTCSNQSLFLPVGDQFAAIAQRRSGPAQKMQDVLLKSNAEARRLRGEAGFEFRRKLEH